MHYLSQQFWNRWRREYLNSTILRQQRHAQRQKVQGGDTVIVKKEEVPHNEWKLAKVIDVCKDDEGLVRKVTIQIGERNSFIHCSTSHSEDVILVEHG